MRTDFEQIADGATVKLHPMSDNPLHKEPVSAVFTGGYFYCEGTCAAVGPDYYLGDVQEFCVGYEMDERDK